MADYPVAENSVAIFGALPDWNLPAAIYPEQGFSIDAASSAGADSQPERLQDGKMTSWWRSTSGFRRLATVDGFSLDAAGQPVGAIGLGGCSLTPNGKVRYRMRWDGDDIPSRTRLAPNAVVTQTNVTGSLSDVTDDPGSPGGTHMVVSGGGSILELGWATPSAFEQVVEGCHSFRVRIQNTGSAAISLLSAKLRQSSVDRAQLLADRDGNTKFLNIPAGADVIVELPFSPSSLSNPDGSSMTLKLELQAATGGESRYRAVDLHYEQTLPSTDYYDSGLRWAWTTEILGLVSGSAMRGLHPTETWGAARTHAHAVAVDGVYTTIAGVQRVRIELHDPWADYVQAALALWGPAVGVRLRPELTFGSAGRQVVATTAAGNQVWAYRRGRIRGTAPCLLSREDGDYLLRFLSGRKAGYPFLYIPEPAGERYFHTRPHVVTTGEGDPPELALHARNGSGGIWTLGSIGLQEYW